VELLGPDGLLSQVTKAVLERALAEEMTGHLGYDKHDPAGRGSGNNRNGTTGKTVLTDIGAVDLAVPGTATGPSSRRSSARARPGWRVQRADHRAVCAGDDHPRHPGATCARSMASRFPGPDLPSHRRGRRRARGWQSRPLDRVYPVIFIDALMVKIRDGVVTNRAVYWAIGIDCDGPSRSWACGSGPPPGSRPSSGSAC
jgi:hypothetical protein